jgi:hypothetical protein
MIVADRRAHQAQRVAERDLGAVVVAQPEVDHGEVVQGRRLCGMILAKEGALECQCLLERLFRARQIALPTKR